jgi:hypothetical protein
VGGEKLYPLVAYFVRALYFTVTYTTLASGQMQKKQKKKQKSK